MILTRKQKKAGSILLLWLFTIYCNVTEKNSAPSDNPETSKLEKYIAAEDISVYEKPNKRPIFSMEEGEIFLGESRPENKAWIKINFEDKTGYILSSNKKFNFSFYQEELKYKGNFIVINKRGIPLCKKPSTKYQCDEALKKLNYLETLTLLKPYYMNNSGTWIKVKQDDLVGFVPLSDTVPEELLNISNVESFKKNFHKICPLKKLIVHKDTYACYSTKQYINGDAGEEWKERVYFTVDALSNRFGYGRKYIETNGILFNAELISNGKYKVHYLDHYDYTEENFLVEFNFNKKVLYAPLPETLMRGTYKQVSEEKLEFKNGLR
ncbi:MAG: hypothetical protein KBA66_00115 [Leptospiraceae bacterium]|nr:hypothetical protein [Leptospiraceae bacterium]